jgi:putative membrane protein
MRAADREATADRARDIRTDAYLWWLLASLGVLLLWSGWTPRERVTWWLEVAPIFIGLPLLFATRRRFPLTPLAYWLIWGHAVILLIGGHYTYAEVPLFNWLRDAWGLARNHYDRVGHFAQGFVPAVLAREILLRKGVLRPGGWLSFLVVCVCLAISAAYELIEWWAALLTSPETGAAFLGTQGDVWDTQWDMLMALVGAACALISLSRVHARQLRRLPVSHSPRSS